MGEGRKLLNIGCVVVGVVAGCPDQFEVLAVLDFDARLNILSSI